MSWLRISQVVAPFRTSTLPWRSAGIQGYHQTSLQRPLYPIAEKLFGSGLCHLSANLYDVCFNVGFRGKRDCEESVLKHRSFADTRYTQGLNDLSPSK